MPEAELVRVIGGPRDGERIAYSGETVRLSIPVEDGDRTTTLDWHIYEYAVLGGRPAYVHRGRG